MQYPQVPRLKASRILCYADIFSKPEKINTTGLHNAQQMSGYGDQKPARAIISKTVQYYRNPSQDPLLKIDLYAEIRGHEIVGQFKENAHITFCKEEGRKRAFFTGNPAFAYVNVTAEKTN